jgi:hypothetical protein
MKQNMESAPYMEFRRRWEQRQREAAEVFKHERGAHLIGVLLQDFDAVRVDEVSGEVGVQGATAVSGFSESSIWRFLDDEAVPNVGEPGHPRMRIRDLPFKPRRSEVVGSRRQSAPKCPASTASLGTAVLETIDD